MMRVAQSCHWFIPKILSKYELSAQLWTMKSKNLALNWYSRCVPAGLTHNVAAKRHCQWWRVLLPDSWGHRAVSLQRRRSNWGNQDRLVPPSKNDGSSQKPGDSKEIPLPRKSSVKSSYVAENGFTKRQHNRVLDRILGIPGKYHHNLTQKTSQCRVTKGGDKPSRNLRGILLVGTPHC